jgi:hypothetical protein
MIAAVALTAALTGCQTTTDVFVRTDGQRAKDNPVLASQFEVDRTVCEGEAQKAGLTGSNVCFGDNCFWQQMARNEGKVGVMKGCMAQKGYLLVPAEEAETRAAQFRAAHEAQQAAAIKPAPSTSKR